MILILAIFIGLAVGLWIAWFRKQPYHLPGLAVIWLGIVAFIPQWFVYFLPATRERIPSDWVPLFMIVSQILLVIFVLANSRRSGFWILGIGLLLNLLVILLNGGWMPISPEMVTRLFPNALPGTWEIGQRLGTGKDIVLNITETRLAFLGDRILIPFPPPLHPTAFSIGDFFIALGAARFLSHQVDVKVQNDLEMTLQTIQQPK